MLISLFIEKTLSSPEFGEDSSFKKQSDSHVS